MRRVVGRFRPLDALLIALLLAAPVLALVRRDRTPATELVVDVSRDGRLVGTYRLDRDRTVDVGPDFKVEVSRGRVRVLDSNCPKGVCRHAGWRSAAGSSIICVPNRVVVGIRGANPEFDAESY
ncbi:NusG domain II-containing protein [candidate division WOR-3 bacterium]|nr:NusG domain II-containing protein [candidate division WOR-3 bacterium]